MLRFVRLFGHHICRGIFICNRQRSTSTKNLVSYLSHKTLASSKTLFHFNKSARNRYDELSYQEFWKLVGQYAIVLRQNEIKLGDRVAGQVSKRVENVALYLATLQVGGIYVPLNTAYTKQELTYLLSDAEPKLFVCQHPDLEKYKENFGRQPKLCICDEEDLKLRAITCDPNIVDMYKTETTSKDDVATVCYTSGTTGKPKGAMITHGNLISNAEVLREAWKISAEDQLLHALPIYHVHGLFVGLNPLMSAGGSMAFLPSFDIDSVLKWLSSCNVMMGVPTYYSRLLSENEFKPKLVGHFRLFVSGSAPMLEKTWEDFKRKSGGHEILERYGMTEGQMICSNPYEGQRKCGTVGPPLSGVDLRIVNGSLQYKSPSLFPGYWRMPEKTKSEFTEDGYFISGDLAEMDSDGFVRILGRDKDMIISGGLNVYPKEIEEVLEQFPGIEEVAVVGIPHPDFGEAVVAAAVISECSGNLTDEQWEKNILSLAKQQLAGYKMPKRVLLESCLPRNSMGKIQKNDLRRKYQQLFAC